jgi:alpha-glucoside transport system substrate-binding protein
MRSVTVLKRQFPATLAIICLLAAACAGGSTSPAGSPPATTGPSPAASASAGTSPSSGGLLDPEEAALIAAGGQPLGGSVSILGVLGGDEQDAFVSTLAPFEEATGVRIDYESTRDLASLLQTRVDGGNPPDVVITPTIGQMFSFAEAGQLIDLGQVLDVAALAEHYDQGLVDLASRDGHLFGLFHTVNLGDLIWYNPKTYAGPTSPATWDELDAWAAETAASGTTPWCMGLESEAASGWPGAEFVTGILLRQAGPEFHDRWWQGEVPWTSPEIRTAFETFGAIATDPQMVYGGPQAVLATSFSNGADAIFADPPQCYLHEQATFMGDIILGNFPDLKPIDDVDFFAMPDFSAQFTGLQQISGEIVVLFNDTPQARAAVKFMAAPESANLIAETGRWLAPDKRVPLEAYQSPFLRRAAEILQRAGGVSYLGSDLLPQPMVESFWKATLDYVNDPAQLDAILAKLEEVRGTAFQ